jgi:CheY-like chemotaxis protein
VALAPAEEGSEDFPKRSPGFEFAGRLFVIVVLDLIMPGIDGCALLDGLWMDDREMLPGTFRA